MTQLFNSSISWIRPLYERTSFHTSVIDEVKDQKLRKAYATCRSITRRYAKTFYMATRFLPNHKQRGIFAVYALCRYLDDLVDEAEDLIQQEMMTPEDVKERLKLWKYNLEAAYKGMATNNVILNAFSDVLNQYYIPVELPFQLMEGVTQDLVKNRYKDFDELYNYSYKVASVVGLMTSRIFGYSSPEAKEYAVNLGIAMQLTNIIRDIGEDINRDRIYIPKTELFRFNVSEHDFLSGQLNTSMIKLLRFQVARARRYYEKAEPGIGLLERDSRLPVYLASRNYSRILDKVEENGYDVFSQRAYLNSTEKLSILPGVWLKMVY